MKYLLLLFLLLLADAAYAANDVITINTAEYAEQRIRCNPPQKNTDESWVKTQLFYQFYENGKQIGELTSFCAFNVATVGKIGTYNYAVTAQDSTRKIESSKSNILVINFVYYPVANKPTINKIILIPAK